MNFFGHATIACRYTQNPTFVLGAMFPDFVSMCGNRLDDVRDESISDGIELHLGTDDAFHHNGIFIDLCSKAVRSLNRVGVRVSSARAVAHVGIELLLDGALPPDEDVRHSYHDALLLADSGNIANQIVWENEYGQERWKYLIGRLRAANIPDGYRDPIFVVERLRNILGTRPRLALTEAESVSLLDWVTRAHARVFQKADRLMTEVCTELEKMEISKKMRI